MKLNDWEIRTTPTLLLLTKLITLSKKSNQEMKKKSCIVGILDSLYIMNEILFIMKEYHK